MVRMVNERNQILADVNGRLTLLRRIPTEDGHIRSRFVDLPLEMSSPPLVALSWALIHVIDELSPLHGATTASLEQEGSILLASVSGYDESISAPVTARHAYFAKSLQFGRRFVDITDQLPSGELVLDLEHFHDTVAASESQAS
jgi:inward rectifier potassium channel